MHSQYYVEQEKYEKTINRKNKKATITTVCMTAMYIRF